MHISPHLSYNGQCRIAFEMYQRILGGKITMLAYGESPMASQVDPKLHDRIVHATLALDSTELNGADVMPQDYLKPQGFSVILNIAGKEKGFEVFTALAEGGEIKYAFQPAFWSPGYGALVDRFGVPWEINSSETGNHT
jgi:PhnB protein